MSLLRAGLRLLNAKPSINKRIQELSPEFEGYFHEMHRKPGLAFNEATEKAIIRKKLGDLGVAFQEIAGGIVATIEGKKSNSKRIIGLTADMDALPVVEKAGGKQVVSERDGVSHMCGHDGHAASLLLAAQYLQETRNFDGTARLIWRPAEETGQGAKAMLDAGLFEKFPVDEIYGFHNYPNFPLGFGAVSAGPVLCGSRDFRITITGKDGHAGWTDVPMEQQALYAMSGFLKAKWDDTASFMSPLIRQGQSIKSGRALVSVSGMSVISPSSNVISPRAQCFGTIRALRDEDFVRAAERLHSIWDNVNHDQDITFSLEFLDGATPPLVNSKDQVTVATKSMHDILGSFAKVYNMPLVTGTDDFAFLSNEVPGCYFALTGGDDDPDHPHSQKLHTAGYIFNKDLLPVAGNILARIVENRMPLPEM